MKRSVRAFINQLERVDYKIIICLVLLNAFGLLMIYSASGFLCSINKEYNYDDMYLVKRQAVFVVLGFIGMFLIWKINYNIFRKFAVFIYILGVCSIFLLLTPLAKESHEAVRWIKIGSVTLQIAEPVKISLIIGLAYFFSKYYKRMKYIRVILLVWIFGAIPALLIYKISENLSTAIIILGITFALTFIMAPNWQLHAGVVAGAAGLIALGVWYLKSNLPSPTELDKMSFRIGRFAAWLAPEQYADSQALQPLQALYAVASGGLKGRGFGRGIQKLEKIPEAHNDMIFSVVCEELGAVGAILLIILFVYFIYLLTKVSLHGENIFGTVLAMGITLHVALQTIINISVVLMIIPNTGVSLPFISYGGSAVFFTLLEMGMVLSVNRNHMQKKIRRKMKENE